MFTLLVALIALGGLTRLTDSGLSITEWRPVTGAWPPMSEAAWQAEFDKYKNIDEFLVQNKWMALSDFKSIYWWEWSHRQLGRSIGLVWALGFFGFLIARKIPPGWTGRLIVPGVLGGLQGAVGWWMVSSGVVQGEGTLDVASYRLALHLGLAFIILGVIAWYLFALGREERDLMQARRTREGGRVSLTTWMLVALFVQVLLGALVAGIDAGRGFTDWPLMGGQVFPPDAYVLQPMWRNFFESPGLVQWIHRVGGYLVFALGVVVWMRGRRSPHAATRGAFNAMFAVLSLQVVLGIFTVIYGAPWPIAIVHQFVAVALWVLLLRARFISAYPIATSVRGSA
jgi:heme a synthase